MMVATRSKIVPSHAARLTFFGHPRVEIDGRRYEAGLSTMSLATLAMIATAGEALRRDEVAFTLWPDHLESDARASLRRHMYRINQALPTADQPWIEATSRTVAWRSTGTVDVVEFERLCGSPDTVDDAIAIYVDDFLPSIDHEWVNRERTAMRRKACSVLERAIASSDPQNAPARTLSLVEKLLALDPWREDAVRALLCLRARLGDRAGALAHFQHFRTRLRSEFEVDPLAETVEVYAAIAAGTFSGRYLDALAATLSTSYAHYT